MNLIENYNDYFLDYIIENIKHDETALVISNTLMSYLTQIEHPIAYDIINTTNDIYNTKVKVTLLDIVEKEGVYDLISFIQSNKAIQHIANQYGIELSKEIELSKQEKENIAFYIKNNNNYFTDVRGRAETTLGRIVNKLFPNKYKDHEIGIFVEMFKSLRKPFDTFELVKGDDIRYWYNKDRYKEPDNQSSIWKSCMRHNKCYDYLKFYSINNDKVSLLILKDPEDLTKILGRAIVWKLDEIDGEKVDENEPRYFMDRIYYYQDYMMNAFINYAISQNWIYKSQQNMNTDEKLIDKKNNKVYNFVKIYDIKDTGRDYYPYIDTVRYYDTENNVLSNKTNGFYKFIELNDINGGAEGLSGDYWSDYYGEYIDVDDDDYNYCEYGDDYRHYDDCFYSEYYDVYVTNDYAESYGVFCDYSHRYDHGDKWRRDGDYVEIYNSNSTATEKYAEYSLSYSEYLDAYLLEDDAIWSNYHDTYLYVDDAVEVYLNVKQSKTDWRDDDDNTWFTWDHDGEKYDENVSESELKEYHGLNDED